MVSNVLICFNIDKLTNSQVSNVLICFNIDKLTNSRDLAASSLRYLSHFLFLSMLEPLSWLLQLSRVDENAVVVFINFIQSHIARLSPVRALFDPAVFLFPRFHVF